MLSSNRPAQLWNFSAKYHLFFCVLISSASFAQVLEEQELELSFGDEDFVSIATGKRQTLAEAPAVASVITSDQIRSSGARDLDQALEAIPGMHVSVSNKAYNPIYVMRGVYTGDNPQVLILINGIPITNIYIGDRSQVWGGMPVENISRIEVIRGPGSAVYGADAFAGTVNIITKNAKDIEGIEVGGSAGSFDTRRAWALYGKQFDNWELALSLQLLSTNGQNEKIVADQQTIFDQLFGTSVSHAPGPVNTSRDSIDIRADLMRDSIRYRIGYQGRRDVGTGAGVNQALDPSGEGESDRFNADITYHQPNFSEFWDVQAQLSYFNTGFSTRIFALPEGTLGGAFPNGVIGEPELREGHTRVDISGFYTKLDRHELRVGAGYYYQDLYEVKEKKNFITVVIPDIGPALIPLGALSDVSDIAAFVKEETREIYYAFIQDEWKLARDWALTLGLRLDHYSDFGTTLNPRVALVWQTSLNLTTKFLFGRAFRAPSFAEQFNINNPVAIGNNNLDPEIIYTYEIALDYSVSQDLGMSLNLFYYEMQDIIRFAPTIANNIGNQKGTGLEWELNWQTSRNLHVRANYAFQNSEDQQTGLRSANAPRHQFYFHADYDLSSDWLLGARFNSVIGRSRAFGDSRSDISNYNSFDIILTGKNILPDLDLQISVRNIANERFLEPSLAPGVIPSDLPLAGRSVYAEIRKAW